MFLIIRGYNTNKTKVTLFGETFDAETDIKWDETDIKRNILTTAMTLTHRFFKIEQSLKFVDPLNFIGSVDLILFPFDSRDGPLVSFSWDFTDPVLKAIFSLTFDDQVFEKIHLIFESLVTFLVDRCLFRV